MDGKPYDKQFWDHRHTSIGTCQFQVQFWNGCSHRCLCFDTQRFAFYICSEIRVSKYVYDALNCGINMTIFIILFTLPWTTFEPLVYFCEMGIQLKTSNNQNGILTNEQASVISIVTKIKGTLCNVSYVNQCSVHSTDTIFNTVSFKNMMGFLLPSQTLSYMLCHWYTAFLISFPTTPWSPHPILLIFEHTQTHSHLWAFAMAVPSAGNTHPQVSTWVTPLASF